MPREAVALFVPCYVDQLYPRVGLATARLLEDHGAAVYVPPRQTCCGQPMFNAGCRTDAARVARHFVEVFRDAARIVAPSASCVAFVKHRVPELVPGDDAARVAERTWELCGFLVDVLGVRALRARFPHRVALHDGCHAVRELGYGPGELQVARANPVEQLLGMVGGLDLRPLARAADCCGFGGVFSVTEPDVSCAMGRGRLADAAAAGVDVLASADMSCLMHLEGVARRERLPLRLVHVAQILAGDADA